MPKSTGTRMTASCRVMAPRLRTTIRIGGQVVNLRRIVNPPASLGRGPPRLWRIANTMWGRMPSCAAVCNRRPSGGGPIGNRAAAYQAAHRLLLWYLLATGTYKLRLVGGGSGRRLALALRRLGLPRATGGEEGRGHVRQLGSLVGAERRTKCGVITTSNSSLDFCVLRLRNSFPRMGMSPKPGTLFMTSVTWLLISPRWRSSRRL